jgi:hypothetical protein
MHVWLIEVFGHDLLVFGEVVGDGCDLSRGDVIIVVVNVDAVDVLLNGLAIVVFLAFVG